jgi:5-methyltetrahydropteroyltriglutamate--homocysteine methyltransferase
MTGALFPTQEIGSLQKPSVEALHDWEKRVHFLARLPPLAEEVVRHPDVATLQDMRAAFAIAYLESAGLDRIYDGEARRVEMYEYAVRQMTGFEFQGHVRSWDSKYYRKGTVVNRVDLVAPYHLEEFEFVRDHSHSAVKLPITGPYTLADWSYNEYYLARQSGWKGRAQRRAAQREFVVDLARRVLRPTLKQLIDHGCRIVQIDEPAAGTHPDETALVVEGFNEATQGLDAEFSMHICYSRYQDLLPALLEAKSCRQWAWEFANRDGEGRDGYEVLKLLREYGDSRSIGLGVVDVHRDTIETPEQVSERIQRASRYLGDPTKIWANPDCGLRTRSLEVAYAKLRSVVDGASLARAAMGGADDGARPEVASAPEPVH